ncbi:uncharacterized protein [Primulina huaijiensis]|uniref:uncharacterized protein isoform X2 n=1 Tax=Primulina huaijiensis TaxID=1492673 RepID=UPI003CC6FCAD
MEEKVEEFLRRKADGEGADLTFPPHRPHHESSFFEYFILRGVKFHSLQHDSFSCSFQVPPRLTDENGNLAVGAISALVDEIGAAAIHREGLAMDVSVDMSISYLSPAKVNDELDIVSRFLGNRGSYYGTIVVIRNKLTGEVVAEGRHSLYRKPASKI